MEPFTDRIQTKNRADLKAAVAALKMVSDGVVEIRTRSEYVFQNVQYELEVLHPPPTPPLPPRATRHTTN